MNKIHCWWRVLALLTGIMVPLAAAAQNGTVTVTPGPQYGAGGLKAEFFGRDHRALWTTPLQVEVLDLRAYAGGLKLLQRGGGLQTRSLRFQGADGREYVFRSMDKNPHLTREPALRNTPVGDIIQDQTSSLHPGAPLVAASLLETAGVLHSTPRLYVLPDDAALGEFRQEFAGMLGWVEERPEEMEPNRPGFAGFSKIESTADMLEELEEDQDDRVDERAYLRARLMDLFLNDWDRHEDQWRWGEQERGNVTYWIPVPRDRDYAFVDYDGWFMTVGRRFMPNAVLFTDRIQNVYGLTLNARALDRRLLTGLEREVWDSMAVDLQRRLTDAAIDRAVGQLPPELARLEAAELARRLKSRRETIDEAAREFYSLLNSEVDVRATDKRDLLLVDRERDEVVRVRLFARGEDGDGRRGEPFYDRRFYGDQTNEVRIYLHGNDDRAVVRGDVNRSLKVRVIGGGGDDVMVDSSRVRGEDRETGFYDDRGDNTFVRGADTGIDADEYEAPPPARILSGETYRDWGSDVGFAPLVDFRETEGLIVGGGPTYIRYGFRKHPFAYQLTARLLVGLGSGNFGAAVTGNFFKSGSPEGYTFRLRASQLESMRFYGYGNDTELDRDRGLYTVEVDEYLAEGAARLLLPGGVQLSAGPVLKYTRYDAPAGMPFAVENAYGDGIGQVGGAAELMLDLRDQPLFPRRGLMVQGGATAYPGVWGLEAGFVEAHAAASTYLTAPIGLRPTLALRAGGKQVFGDFPIHEAAFLGGSATVRGLPYRRYAGDAMLFGNAEIRLPLGQAKFLVRGDLGAVALADVGRVFVDGESEGGWHSALGGGLTYHFRIRDSLLAASAVYAHGEVGRVYLRLGAPF